jgi:serine/threonine protein kinase
MQRVGDVISLEPFQGKKYVISKIIEGGFGIVYYLQNDTTSDGDYIIKMFKEKMDYESSEREIMLWSRLGYNKYIAEYYLWGTYLFEENEKKLFILAKRYKYTLADIKSESITNNNILKIISGIISGLYYANNKLGLIHRDIKPSNIFMDKDFNVKIGDFGISTYINKKYILNANFSSIKEFNVISQQKYGGTLPFMPPEILINNNNDFNLCSDIYAIGVTIFNILTNNKYPYELPEFKLFNAAWDLFNKVNIDQNIKNVIVKCLNLNKEKRYLNYDEIAADLNIEIDTVNENDEVYSIIGYIGTLFTMNKKQEAMDIINPLLEKYPNHPLLINRLANHCGDHNVELNYYKQLFIERMIYPKHYYFDPLFNYAKYYFENKNVSRMIEIIDNNYEYIKEDLKFCSENYKEYCVYIIIKNKNLNSIQNFISYLERHTDVPDKYLFVFFFYSFKLNKLKESLEILKSYRSDNIRNILQIISSENSTFINDNLSKMSIDLFGEIV